jgi:hypothetical protein
METSKGWIEVSYEQLLDKVVAKEPIVVTCEGMTCYYRPLDGKTFVAVGGEIVDTKPDAVKLQANT